MVQTSDDHALSVEEEQVAPVVVLVTIVLCFLFAIAALYRLGITVL